MALGYEKAHSLLHVCVFLCSCIPVNMDSDCCFIQKAIISYKHCSFCCSYDPGFASGVPFKQASVFFLLLLFSLLSLLSAPTLCPLMGSHHYFLGQKSMSDLSLPFPTPVLEPALSSRSPGFTQCEWHLETKTRVPGEHAHSQRVLRSTGPRQCRLFQLGEGPARLSGQLRHVSGAPYFPGGQSRKALFWVELHPFQIHISPDPQDFRI